MSDENSNEKITINWYPGHIAKAEKQLKEKIKIVDFIIEIRDSRIPDASSHRDLHIWANNKPIISLFNKSDLCDRNHLKSWIQKNKSQYPHISGFYIMNNRKGIPRDVFKAIDRLALETTQKFKDKGILKRPARVMVVGYPNVGKSSIINLLAAKKKTKVENRPGVTVRQQWVDVKSDLDIKLLDTPGIIPTKLYSNDQGLKLAICNCVSHKSFDPEEVVKLAIPLIESIKPGAINSYYKLKDNQEINLDNIAMKRNWIEWYDGKQYPDLHRAASKFLTDFRTCQFGMIGLE